MTHPRPLIGRRLIYPLLLPFPIWRYGPIYDRIDGRYVRDGWWPDRYGTREVECDKESEL